MIQKLRIVICTMCILLLCNCKPYNADESNNKLIQGKWMLVDADRDDYDSVKIDYSRQVTYLIFDGDKCTQQMPDLDEDSNYRFIINNYELKLYQDTALVNMLKINTLSADSLVLTQFENSCWKYIKIEQ